MAAAATQASRAVPAVEEREREIELPDGRRLSYVMLGAPAGPLVVVQDGPGSRGLARGASGIAASLGIRLVAPDRPGFFGSTPNPGRSFTDWPADLAALLDHLGERRVGILGQSGGTPYSLVAAAELEERVIAVALTGPIAPMGDPEMLSLAGKKVQMGIKLARRAPWLLRFALRSQARKWRKNPEKTATADLESLPPVDAEMMRDPELFAGHVQAMGEILSRDAAVVTEFRMLGKPWGFDASRVNVPVAVWSGDRDEFHPTPHARRIAEMVGGAPVHVVHDAATFGLQPRYGDAMRFALGQ
jgi:pimeloyl-ACP methyl ester carboxylesterase